MILETAGMVTTLGIVGWIIGRVFDMYGVAMIGAVLILGVGASVANGGLAYQDGQTVEEQAVILTFENESATADVGNYTPLQYDDLERNNTTVYYDDGGTWVEGTEGTDYEMNYSSGAIKALSGGAISDGAALRVTYDYASDTQTRTVKRAEYERTSTPERLPLGAMWMLLGGVLGLRALGSAGEG